MSNWDSQLSRYHERLARTGQLTITPVLPEEDGGTGSRWGASWAPGEDKLADIDADGATLDLALINLIHGMGEEILNLRQHLDTEKR